MGDGGTYHGMADKGQPQVPESTALECLFGGEVSTGNR